MIRRRRSRDVAHHTWLVIVVLLGLSLGCADTEEVSNEPPGAAKRWEHIEFVERYSFEGPVLESEDLSGIACVSPTRCLVGADESRSVQVVALSRADKTLTALRTIELLGSGGEIDIEGIAVEADFYYVVGSHGIAKKSGDVQGNRYRLFRLKVDPATGLPGVYGAIATLSDILRDDPVLGLHFGKPLQQKGVNIEGLAIRNGRLFVGLRNPNLDGYAYVIEVGADDVFGATTRPRYVLHKLRLGAGLGIREIVALRTGFLIVAGNAGSEPSEEFPETVDYEKGRGFYMFYWAGKDAEADEIGSIPDAPGKAEAMTVLEEAADHVMVLILFDGAENGRPSVYRID
ncbi:MAG: DUF3616 domain-containing protein [Sedimentisphaerales bacterium]|nr:DUF3616 domain-containing protein [Sedimentisphaerales bacterium]